MNNLNYEDIPKHTITNQSCQIKGCQNKHYAKGYCSKHYANVRRHGYPEKPFYTRKLDYEIDENGCFICTSHQPNNYGYPIIRIRGKSWPVSRFIYFEMFGELEEGLVVRHKCDNRKCINPEHLEPGTIADNNRDAVERGRNTKGSKCHTAILTEEQVEEIKYLILDGKTNKELAEKFSVDHRIISNIRHERRWKHVKVN